MPKSQWIPDQSRPNCSKCQRKFDNVHRRHHCRICGEVFCKKCSSRKVATKRVCDDCKLKVEGSDARRRSTGDFKTKPVAKKKEAKKMDRTQSLIAPKSNKGNQNDLTVPGLSNKNGDDSQTGLFSNESLNFVSENVAVDGQYVDLEPTRSQDMTAHDDGQDLQLQEIDLS